jgi:hypothetical protein
MLELLLRLVLWLGLKQIGWSYHGGFYNGGSRWRESYLVSVMVCHCDLSSLSWVKATGWDTSGWRVEAKLN